MNKKNLIRIWNVGRVSYGKGLLLQNALTLLHTKQVDPKINHDTILIVEHTPVYTIGIRTKEYDDTAIKLLKATGAEFYKTNRGGLITFHGPGQLVAYPIINLKHYRCSVRWYVAQLEKCIIDLCKNHFNLNATTSPYTGVWVGDKKICAMGIHASRFITSHGLALNCNVDLTWYNHIVPCGIKDKGVTSLSKEVQRNVDLKIAIPLFLESFQNTFQCDSVLITEGEEEDILGNLTAINKEVLQ